MFRRTTEQFCRAPAAQFFAEQIEQFHLRLAGRMRPRIF
jgi:hypothetical protein